MRFGAWHPIEDAAAAAPPAAGVLQARAERVIAYPAGRSAMILYTHSGETGLRAFLGGAGAALLGRAAAAGARHVRFAETPEPAAACARLLARFVERFGAPPRANAERGNDDGRKEGPDVP